MKNLLRTFIVLVVSLTLSKSPIWGQTYTMKKPVGEELDKELILFGKQLFEPKGSLEYDISTNDLIGSIGDMTESSNYDIAYKELQERELKSNPKNSILWNNLGNYYKFINDMESARKNYQKAYDLMDSTFSKDSSYFYSYKGILKMNLGMEGGLEDLEHAIQIDPTDSIAITFLPFTLLNSGQFAKAKEYCYEALQKSEGPTQGTWYLFYLMADIFKQIGELQQSGTSFDQMRDKQYDEIIDLSGINAIYDQYKANQSVANAKLLSDILTFYFKLLTFEFKDGKFVLKYSKKETLRLHEIETTLINIKDKAIINEFSRIKALAFLSFLQGKTTLAKEYFEQAVTIFPEEKISDNFNPNKCYSALFFIYSIEKDITASEKILTRMIERDQTIGPNVTHLCDMAKCYLQEDNYEQLGAWLDQAFLASATDFETLRLLMHYYFFYRIDRNASDEYFKTILPLISSEDQNYNLCIQFVLYGLSNGNAPFAMQYLKSARDTYPGEPCEQCDELEKKYIKISK